MSYAYGGYSDSPAAVLNSLGTVIQGFVTLPGGVMFAVQANGTGYRSIGGSGFLALTSADEVSERPERDEAHYSDSYRRVVYLDGRHSRGFVALGEPQFEQGAKGRDSTRTRDCGF
jgi:hypothetical protein